MTTITEDYVSFETAKLLKEKGFDGRVHRHYHIWDGPNHPPIPDSIVESSEAPHLYIIAPTLQMAMKWLREAHNIYIDIRFNRTYQRYKYFVFFMGTNEDDMYDHTNLSKKESYEETVESALRYCLENLI